MTYTGNYIAFIKYTDGTRHEWTGLRKTQAQWRYHWIQRNTDYRNEFQGKQFNEFGWQREWRAA